MNTALNTWTYSWSPTVCQALCSLGHGINTHQINKRVDVDTDICKVRASPVAKARNGLKNQVLAASASVSGPLSLWPLGLPILQVPASDGASAPAAPGMEGDDWERHPPSLVAHQPL